MGCRPNILVEPGMQWVGFRNDWVRGLAIWHEGTATITCDLSGIPVFSLDSYLGDLGGKFPSRKVWFNGIVKREVSQRAFSDLWTEHPSRTGYVE